jgi:hypothetical protein
VIVAALAALSAGCGATVPGTPRADPNGPALAAGPAGLSSSQLGDLGTLDPCSLIDQDMLPGTVTSSSSLQRFDQCVTELKLGLVTAVPDLDSAQPVPSPLHHRCPWSRDG